MQRACSLRYLFRVLLCLLVLSNASITVSLVRAHAAAAPKVTALYSATQAAYDNWDESTPPQATKNFPAGTKIMSFYFSYENVSAKQSTFQIIVRDHENTPVITGKQHVLNYSNGSQMLREDYGDPFPNDTYRADLSIDDVKVASTTFTVGNVPSPSSSVSIDNIYLISKAAYTAWDPNSGNDPPVTRTFDAKVREIGLFFTYSHAHTTTDTFQFLLTTVDGNQIGKGKIYPFHYETGAEALLLPVNADVQLVPGRSYYATLLINNTSVKQLSWTIGNTSTTPSSTPLPAHPVGTPVSPTICNATSLEQVVRCDEPSVLRVHVKLADGVAEGTSFVVHTDSTGTYLLTNKHVVADATAENTSIYTPDGTVLAQRVLAIQSNTGKSGTPGDLAIIRIPPTTLPVLHWGNSDTLNPGQTVASIGYGLAFELAGPPSVTQGIVSAVHRDLGDSYGPVWIQHQSTINHGNSGGPLVDARGDVVGVNTLSIDQLPDQSGHGTESVQGVFFAIPASIAKTLAQKLISDLQNSTTIRGTPSPQPASTTYTGQHYTVTLPKNWSVTKPSSGGYPILISNNQLIQVLILASPIPKGQSYSATDLSSRGKQFANDFGKVKKIATAPVTLAGLSGMEVSATFSDTRNNLDVFLLPARSGKYLFIIARAKDPAASQKDVQQSLSVLSTLKETN